MAPACSRSRSGYQLLVESSWNVMAHGDARDGNWMGNWRMEWVASTLRTTSNHGVSSIITADAHTSAASSRLNWRPRRFKWTRPFRRKTKSGFSACTVTFQLTSTVPPTFDLTSSEQAHVLQWQGTGFENMFHVLLLILTLWYVTVVYSEC